MINLLSKADDFIQHEKFVNENGKVKFLKKKRRKRLLCCQGFVLLDWFGRSGHDRSQSFGPLSHVSGPKLTF